MCNNNDNKPIGNEYRIINKKKLTLALNTNNEKSKNDVLKKFTIEDSIYIYVRFFLFNRMAQQLKYFIYLFIYK